MPTTVTFAFTGAHQTWAVPGAAISPITIDARGAGGNFAGDGAGGHTVGTLAVAGSDILTIDAGGVGGAGTTTPGAGGWPDGGAGGAATGTSGQAGYGGSGSSRVYKNGTALANLSCLAGGAGATGRSGSTGAKGAGGAGGAGTGQTGTSATLGGGAGGTGGSQVAGGTGGLVGTGGTFSGAAGAQLQGGAGGATVASTGHGGGGGGGGYFGGGGGGSSGSTVGSGGGGGGSNYVGGLAVVTVNTQGGGSPQGSAGTVAVTYNTAPLAPYLVPPNYFAAGKCYTTWPTVFQWLMSDADPTETIVSSNFRYRTIGNPVWTTVNTVLGAGTTVGGIDFVAGALAVGNYEAQVQTIGSDGLTSPFCASVLFTVEAPPAAAYPYADVPDQWPEATALGQLTVAAQMASRIDDKVNKLARWVNNWASDDPNDMSRTANVGFSALLSVTTTVAPNVPVPWDSIDADGPLQIGSPGGFGTPGVWQVTHAGLYYIDVQVRDNLAVSAYTISLLGLPAIYATPIIIQSGVVGNTGRLSGFFRLAGGEQISVQHNQASNPQWSGAFTDAGGNTGHSSRFQAWRVGP